MRTKARQSSFAMADIRSVVVATVLAAGSLLIGATQNAASSTPSSSDVPGTPAISTHQVRNSARAAHVSGVMVAAVTSTGKVHKPPPEPAFNGAPPLLYRGPAGCFSPPCLDGHVMMTAETGPL